MWPLLSIECFNALLNIIKFKKYITKLPNNMNILHWPGNFKLMTNLLKLDFFVGRIPSNERKTMF